EQERLGQWASTRAVFFKNGAPLKAGDRLVQKDLAKSLRQIARHGSKAFYRGGIGDKIVAEMAQHGGLIDRDERRVVSSRIYQIFKTGSCRN
ncbi:MAG TPA: gamma-glutamyltransferase, partial [Syntrophales bacterium]|nr:gamma-glutamyltransferase [Syntrophales bacterium]